MASEAFRVPSERFRANAEGLRVPSERFRANAEGLRVPSERFRVPSEAFREASDDLFWGSHAGGAGAIERNTATSIRVIRVQTRIAEYFSFRL